MLPPKGYKIREVGAKTRPYLFTNRVAQACATHRCGLAKAPGLDEKNSLRHRTRLAHIGWSLGSSGRFHRPNQIQRLLLPKLGPRGDSQGLSTQSQGQREYRESFDLGPVRGEIRWMPPQHHLENKGPALGNDGSEGHPDFPPVDFGKAQFDRPIPGVDLARSKNDLIPICVGLAKTQ